MDSFFRDLFQLKGLWSDWKMTAAPAYIPDMMLYGIFFHLIPSVAGRILAVTMFQVFFLLAAANWLSKIIRPDLSHGAKTFIVMILSALVIVASNSGMWLFFYSTNNHFSSLLFSLISLGLYLKLNVHWSKKNVIFFCVSVIFAQLSSPLFFLTFSLPMILVCIAQSFLLKKDESPGIKRNKFLLLIVFLHVISHILNKAITSHNGFDGRFGFSVSKILNSFKAFIEATKVTVSFDNSYTFFFFLFVALSFFHLIYHYIYKKRLKLEDLLSMKNRGSFNTGHRQSFLFFYFLLTTLVTILGSIFSGGFVDVFGYRYFTFPIALCLILWITLLDSKAFFDRFFYVLIGIYILLLGIAFVSPEKFFKESGRDNYYQLYKLGVYSDRVEDKTGECLNHLSDVGFKLRAGVASYWNARGVSYKTRNNTFILPILNDAMPFFWMSSLGPLKYSSHYDADYYNFAILYKAKTLDQFNFNTSTIGANLPEPSETIECGDREIWIYKNQSLDKYIKEKVRNFLFLEGELGKFDFPLKILPSQTGKINGNERLAVYGSDKPGFLVYGPYIRLPKGKYKIQITYLTNSEKNLWDIGRFNNSRKYFNRNTLVGSGVLPNTQNLESTQTFIVDVTKHISDFEVRIFYGGEGDFILRSMKMTREENR